MLLIQVILTVTLVMFAKRGDIMEQTCGEDGYRIMELERRLSDLHPQFEDLVSTLSESQQKTISAFLSVLAQYNMEMMYEMYMLGKEQGRQEK